MQVVRASVTAVGCLASCCMKFVFRSPLTRNLTQGRPPRHAELTVQCSEGCLDLLRDVDVGLYEKSRIGLRAGTKCLNRV